MIALRKKKSSGIPELYRIATGKQNKRQSHSYPLIGFEKVSPAISVRPAS